MPSFNKCIFAGHVTRDPQLRYLPSQTSVVDFGLAVNSKWKDAQGQQREDVLFIDCAIFGKRAEALNKYVSKGSPLLVEGRLQLEQWEDKQGGGKRSKHKLVVDNFQFLGARADDEQPEPEQERGRSRQTVPKDEDGCPF